MTLVMTGERTPIPVKRSFEELFEWMSETLEETPTWFMNPVFCSFIRPPGFSERFLDRLERWCAIRHLRFLRIDDGRGMTLIGFERE